MSRAFHAGFLLGEFSPSAGDGHGNCPLNEERRQEFSGV
ncbi:hypothetical protein PCH70_31120 [Pseudomonas cichorii JBC1]|nr:hypothetical protein PCH70_31120 [Pseudomonas cichorii JBC1]